MATMLGISRRRLTFILGATITFSLIVTALCLTLLAKEEKTARHSATRFAAALVHDNPSAAPDGAASYVSGIREYFGPVSRARVIGAHNKGINTGDNADTRSFFVVELLLQTKRGPSAIEVEYDNHAIASETVSRVYELEPSKAPGLTKPERRQLEAAFTKRGSEPADAGRLSASEPPAAPKLRPIAKPARPHIEKSAQLRCIQQAHGDVLKMQECAN